MLLLLGGDVLLCMRFYNTQVKQKTEQTKKSAHAITIGWGCVVMHKICIHVKQKTEQSAHANTIGWGCVVMHEIL